MVNPLSAGGCRIWTHQSFRINTDLAYRPEKRAPELKMWIPLNAELRTPQILVEINDQSISIFYYTHQLCVCQQNEGGNTFLFFAKLSKIDKLIKKYFFLFYS